jgi:hypothetical protein
MDCKLGARKEKSRMSTWIKESLIMAGMVGGAFALFAGVMTVIAALSG